MRSRKFGLYFVTLRILSDILIIPVVVVLAYGLKFKVGWVFQNVFSIQYGKIYQSAQVEPYLQVVGLIVLLWLIAFYFSGLYKSFTGVMPEVDEFVRVVKGSTIASIEVVIVTFIFRVLPESRYVIFYTWGFGILLIFSARMVIHRIEIMLLKKGVGSKATLVIGANAIGQDVAEKIFEFPSLGLRYIGTVDDGKPDVLHFHLRNRFNYLGTVDQIESLLISEKIKVLFITKLDLDYSFLQDLALFCDQRNIELMILSDFANIVPSALTVKDFDGLPFLSQISLPSFSLGQVGKRILDMIVSAIGLVMLLPLFLIVAFFIKIVSPNGPVFYRQERVGLDNKVFEMIKFRTMVQGAEATSGPVMVDESGEKRVIKGGQMIRRLSIDELPQLINVLKGQMSLIGPRPERPFFVDQFSKEIPFFNLRHQVKGGITGWAQINGRSVLTRRPDHKIKYDLYYIRNWSLVFDFKILLKTLFVVFKREEAY